MKRDDWGDLCAHLSTLLHQLSALEATHADSLAMIDRLSAPAERPFAAVLADALDADPAEVRAAVLAVQDRIYPICVRVGG